MGRVVSPNDVFYELQPLEHGPAAGRRPRAELAAERSADRVLHAARAREAATRARFTGTRTSRPASPASARPPRRCSRRSRCCPLLLPLTWLYTAIVFLKLNASFVFAYLWLREERLGRRGAAIGAILFAGAGMYSVRWLWQITNTTALYPALLWIVRRTFNGRRTPIVVTALIALATRSPASPRRSRTARGSRLLYALFCGSAEATPPLCRSVDIANRRSRRRSSPF